MTYTECDLILIAGVGGFALSMMNLYEDSQKPKSKRIPKDFYFWLFFVFWPIAGAGYALLNLLEGNALINRKSIKYRIVKLSFEV